MPTNKYITLTNSNASFSRKFKAIAMRMPESRMDRIDRALSGTVDKQSGPIIRQFSYALRVPQDTPADPTFGTYDDLKTFFGYNNANAVPSDVITLTDHYTVTHSVYFEGQLDPEPLTTMLEGPNAYYIVQITLQER